MTLKEPKYIIVLFILLFTLSLHSINEVIRNDNDIKVRSRGICYLDPGISVEQAKIIAEYDALHELLNELTKYLRKNKILISEPVTIDDIYKYFCNSLNTFIYKEGEEYIDNYPAYIIHLSLSLDLIQFNKEIFRILTDNWKRKQLLVEYKRFEELIDLFAVLKETTNKIEEDFITELTTKLKATDWAHKANVSDDLGLKLDYYAIAVDTDPLYESAYLCLADAQIKIGRYGEAIDLLNKLINLNPLSYAGAYCKRGEIYYHINEYSNAIKELEKAVAMDAEFADGYLYLGAVYSKLSKNETALNYFNKAVKADGMYYKAHFMRGNFFRKSGKYEQALKDYERTISLNSMHKSAYINSGLIYYMTGNFDKAVEAYNKALYLDELNPVLFYNRSISYRKLNEIEKAREDYKSYLIYSLSDSGNLKLDSLTGLWLNDNNFKPMKTD